MKKSRQRRGNIRFFSQSLGIVLWRTGKTKAEQHKFSEEKWAKLFQLCVVLSQATTFNPMVKMSLQSFSIWNFCRNVSVDINFALWQPKVFLIAFRCD